MKHWAEYRWEEAINQLHNCNDYQEYMGLSVVIISKRMADFYLNMREVIAPYYK